MQDTTVIQECIKVASRDSFSDYLEKEFLQRKKTNPAYSLRAFARFIGVDQSTLSKFFKGERTFSWATVSQCLERLSAPQDIVERFEEERHNLLSEYQIIEDAHFTSLSDWKYWAILEFFKIDPMATDDAIAKKFNFEEAEVHEIISKLILLGLVKKDDQKYKLLKPNNSWIDNGKTSEARKELQRKLAKLSASAIDNYSMDNRYHGSLTVAVDKETLAEVKQKFNAFQAELGQCLQRKSNLNEVYQLTISFFPLTTLESK